MHGGIVVIVVSCTVVVVIFSTTVSSLLSAQAHINSNKSMDTFFIFIIRKNFGDSFKKTSFEVKIQN